MPAMRAPLSDPPQRLMIWALELLEATHLQKWQG